MILTNNPVENYKRLKHTMTHSMYGQTLSNIPEIDKMCMTFIINHNKRVNDNDIVFHIGDFGYYGYADLLKGNHVLIMGNYEYQECKEKYDNDIEKFREDIINRFNFIDVIEKYTIDVTALPIFKNIGSILLTHEPMNCIYDRENNKYIYDQNDFIIMNLFGHIHEKCKIKRYGLNVGVDSNHYYPVSYDDVVFYFNTILNYYDENVFE